MSKLSRIGSLVVLCLFALVPLASCSGGAEENGGNGLEGDGDHSNFNQNGVNQGTGESCGEFGQACCDSGEECDVHLSCEEGICVGECEEGAERFGECGVALQGQQVETCVEGRWEIGNCIGDDFGFDDGKLDLLWVLDNSGSMCDAQKTIRDGMDQFINELERQGVDFQMGVTTTHLKTFEEYPLEPVALPGRLQATPQPIPGFDAVCIHPVNEEGEPIRDRFDPVLESLELAIRCTENPEDWSHLSEPRTRDLECAVDSAFFDCEASEIVDLNELFPSPSAYRQLPLVLHSEAYRDEVGNIDSARLKADFACMSLVGTRGFGYEQARRGSKGPLPGDDQWSKRGFLEGRSSIRGHLCQRRE